MKLLPRLFSTPVIALCMVTGSMQMVRAAADQPAVDSAPQVAEPMPSCCVPSNRFSAMASPTKTAKGDAGATKDQHPVATEEIAAPVSSSKNSKSVPEPAISLISGLALAALLICRRGIAR
ncbi:hypothetical protein JIN85_02210 [Luteolibacter pohnpeiensis]|uniref:PEP-CTERM protein-sorting domain-containing protein n=1 Tax=Luteolibacter pohnpeiensis TaxID=454153 RepID=A0A934S9C2_9BACT|nr:hypothetical protein [Luteolibacter pohnpeiensis]MBK1881208.1 hypothetical protein [Luteolibacter pohnpeiensis]